MRIVSALPFVIVPLLAVAGIAFWAFCSFHIVDRTCTVTAKESVAVSGQNQYRVYTEDCGTLQVTDDLFHMRFDSADTYGAIKEGETYAFKTAGYRIPIFSLMPNILEMK